MVVEYSPLTAENLSENLEDAAVNVLLHLVDHLMSDSRMIKLGSV